MYIGPSIHKSVLSAAAAVAVLTLSGCGNRHNPSEHLYSCDEYTVFADSVVQGGFSAKALSSREIISTFEVTPKPRRGSIFHFRFSLNHRNNEFPDSVNHKADILDRTPRLYSFGEISQADSTSENHEMTDSVVFPHDVPWTVRVDMRPVLRSFSTKGYYVTPTSDTIYADSFNGLWITGDISPIDTGLSGRTPKREYKLFDRGDSIYELEIKLNPTIPTIKGGKWTADSLKSDAPVYSSKSNLIDALYNMGVADYRSVMHDDKSVPDMTVASYAVYLALSYLEPAYSKELLRRYVVDGQISSGGAYGAGYWPMTTDRSAWIMAAYEVYKVTGDEGWLKEIYKVASASAERDMATVMNENTGLMRGAVNYAPYMNDPYPEWSSPADVYVTQSLVNNALAYKALAALSDMADKLGNKEDASRYSGKASELLEAINQNLWIPNLGYYSEYLYGSIYPLQAQCADNLGQALGIIFGIATPEMSKSIISRTPRTVYGTPAVFPSIDGKPVNVPFIQAFWNIAASKFAAGDALSAGLGALIRTLALNATSSVISQITDGNPLPDYSSATKPADACAVPATVFRIFAGMDFTHHGITFNPVVPAGAKGPKSITGFRYRDAIIDVTINGTGNRIAAFNIDFKPNTNHLFPDTLKGYHRVDIVLANNSFNPALVTFTDNVKLPATPTVEWVSPRHASLRNFRLGQSFLVMINGAIQEEMSRADYSLFKPTGLTVVDFVPVFSNRYIGFAGKPYIFVPRGQSALLPATDFAKAGSYLVKDEERSEQLVELSPSRNLRYSVNLQVADSGLYLMDLLYANGAGPINGQDRCAVRSVMVNGAAAGAIVMPQRGSDDWRDFGYSNRLQMRLHKGYNEVLIYFDPIVDRNYYGKVNTVLLRSIRLIKKS